MSCTTKVYICGHYNITVLVATDICNKAKYLSFKCLLDQLVTNRMSVHPAEHNIIFK